MKEKLEDKNIFMIIDGNAILHRAYHALPPLTSKDGEPINAVYGFFSMLLKLFQDLKPSFIAVTFDRPKPTFRQNLFVGYQAQRPRMKDDLGGQIKIVHEILESANIPIYEVDGFEADDIIGTLAAQVAKDQKSKRKNQKELKTIIVSGDKDMFQLVDDKTFVLAPILGITKMILYDRQAVLEKLGILTEQVADYKALVGDPSDNYIGINGIGPKTAINLIKQYESVEKMYENIEEIMKDNEKLGLRLAENHEMAVLAKKLATIVCDVPFVFSFEESNVLKINGDSLRSSFERYGFNSLIKRLDGIFPKREGEQLGLLN